MSPTLTSLPEACCTALTADLVDVAVDVNVDVWRLGSFDESATVRCLETSVWTPLTQLMDAKLSYSFCRLAAVYAETLRLFRT
jgi:hypothetical protein